MTDDDNKSPSFGLNNVRLGTLVNGKYVESTPVPLVPWQPSQDVDRPLWLTQLPDFVSTAILPEGVLHRLFPPVSDPQYFQLEFLTKRVRLRRTVLAYQGKPNHIKRLKSIVRLPKVTITRDDKS